MKHFSGTATYSSRFRWDAQEPGAGRRLYLDPGRVDGIAEVRLNDRDLGVLWKPPFHLDVTEAVRAGENHLEVRVTNLWIARLIGDERLPAENGYGEPGPGLMTARAIKRLPGWFLKGQPKPPGGRITFTTWRHHGKNSPLVESGLIGPVQFQWAAVREL
ncbi:MAG: hypothetical protein RMI94_07610 [Bryobacterales bacterium]|nr:hypothetical protein [Bryobacteraceae bacterium]MDW8130401.1 hypothetical protein [Bryobacterales bacterium]